MNRPVALLAATTVIFAATSAYLARALVAERALHPAAKPLQPDVPAEGRQATVAAAAGDGEPSSSATVTHANADRQATVKLPPRVKNRTFSAARLAELALKLQDDLPDLAEVLGLQPGEAAGFLELLARQRIREQEMPTKPRKAADGKDWQQQREVQRQADQVEQAAYLGAARATEWSRYVDGLGSRNEVRELRMRLADSDYPLRRDQYEPLVAALAEEQVRHKGERQRLRGGQRDAANPTPAETIEYLNQRLTLIEESLARRGRAAAAVLDSEQLRRYQAMLEHERLRAQAEYESFVTVNAEAARQPE